jgi:hypothetical protein
MAQTLHRMRKMPKGKISGNYSAYQNMSIDVDSDENVENNK